tara:strand:- start:230 stop:541 length:312 start_codon:yes stop_codon:yes gene_type:complete
MSREVRAFRRYLQNEFIVARPPEGFGYRPEATVASMYLHCESGEDVISLAKQTFNVAIAETERLEENSGYAEDYKQKRSDAIVMEMRVARGVLSYWGDNSCNL